MSLVANDFDAGAVLLDTLIWTAALIALVLVLRRPVTRWLGAPVAYALWALPMLRLVLPPIKLPAWVAPVKEAAPEIAEVAGSPIGIEMRASVPDAVPLAAPVEEATGWLASLGALPFMQIAMMVWLGGAAVFLWLRFGAYFRLRDALMQGAVEVGTTKGPFSTIRLIETPGTNAPLAFGVLKPVIALPPGFMASINRKARDLALAHELEHHRGHDLLINVLVQPLFALHWFNPLGRYGWLAMRRDQEAACDARVIAAAPRETRALYASVIASFAAGPNVALAAPMACPVLGDKSIIHRLRNLTMNEDASNTKSRKMTSRLLLGTAVLALPLTASVSYAESVAPQSPQSLQSSKPAAPAAPQSPNAPAAPDAPQVPAPPQPPEDMREREVTIITVDPDTAETETLDFKTDKDDLGTITVQGKDVMVLRKFEKGDARPVKKRFQTVKIVNSGEMMDEAEMEVIMTQVRDELAAADRDLKDGLEELRIELKALENREEWSARDKEGRTIITMECDSSSDEVATTSQLEDGTTKVLLCQSRIMAHALTGLEQARAAIAANREIKGQMRREILNELDQQIRSWNKQTR